MFLIERMFWENSDKLFPFWFFIVFDFLFTFRLMCVCRTGSKSLFISFLFFFFFGCSNWKWHCLITVEWREKICVLLAFWPLKCSRLKKSPNENHHFIAFNFLILEARNGGGPNRCFTIMTIWNFLLLGRHVSLPNFYWTVTKLIQVVLVLMGQLYVELIKWHLVICKLGGFCSLTLH